MPTWVVKRAAAVTVLTFLVWLGFAAIFPNDRLDLGETVFVWTMIAMALLAWRSMVRVLTWHRTRPSQMRSGD